MGSGNTKEKQKNNEDVSKKENFKSFQSFQSSNQSEQERNSLKTPPQKKRQQSETQNKKMGNQKQELASGKGKKNELDSPFFPQQRQNSLDNSEYEEEKENYDMHSQNKFKKSKSIFGSKVPFQLEERNIPFSEIQMKSKRQQYRDSLDNIHTKNLNDGEGIGEEEEEEDINKVEKTKFESAVKADHHRNEKRNNSIKQIIGKGGIHGGSSMFKSMAGFKQFGLGEEREKEKQLNSKINKKSKANTILSTPSPLVNKDDPFLIPPQKLEEELRKNKQGSMKDLEIRYDKEDKILEGISDTSKKQERISKHQKKGNNINSTSQNKSNDQSSYQSSLYSVQNNSGQEKPFDVISSASPIQVNRNQKTKELESSQKQRAHRKKSTELIVHDLLEQRIFTSNAINEAHNEHNESNDYQESKNPTKQIIEERGSLTNLKQFQNQQGQINPKKGNEERPSEIASSKRGIPSIHEIFPENKDSTSHKRPKTELKIKGVTAQNKMSLEPNEEEKKSKLNSSTSLASNKSAESLEKKNKQGPSQRQKEKKGTTKSNNAEDQISSSESQESEEEEEMIYSLKDANNSQSSDSSDDDYDHKRPILDTNGELNDSLLTSYDVGCIDDQLETKQGLAEEQKEGLLIKKWKKKRNKLYIGSEKQQSTKRVYIRSVESFEPEQYFTSKKFKFERITSEIEKRNFFFNQIKNNIIKQPVDNSNLQGSNSFSQSSKDDQHDKVSLQSFNKKLTHSATRKKQDTIVSQEVNNITHRHADLDDSEIYVNKKEYIKSKNDLQHFGVAVCSRKGNKDEDLPNQDDYLFYKDQLSAIYAVLDGHGPFGHVISNLAYRIIFMKFLSSLNCYVSPETALRSLFRGITKDIDDIIKQSNMKCNQYLSGASCTFIVHRFNSLIISHVGDTKGFVFKKGNSVVKKDKLIATPLTEDHVPSNLDERKRIYHSFGEVRRCQDFSEKIFVRGRDYPGLHITRSIGDSIGTEVGITSDPQIKTYQIDSSDNFIILGTASLFELVPLEEIWQLITPHNSLSVLEASRALQGRIKYLQMQQSQFVQDITFVIAFL